MGTMDTARKRIETIVGLIGFVALLMLGKLIGGAGVAYLAAAVEVGLFCLLPFGDVFAENLGRILRRKREKGQNQAADKQYGSLLAFQSLVGIGLGLLLFLLSDVVAGKVLMVPYAGLLLKIGALLIPIRAIQGVLKAYLVSRRSSGVAMGHMLRPIFWIGLGLLFAKSLQAYGERVGALLHNVFMPSMYGAAGIVLGIVVSELILLVFFLILGLGEKKRGRAGIQEDRGRTDSFLTNVFEVYGSVNLEMMYAFLRRLPLLLGILFYQRNTGDIYHSAGEYGVYYGTYLALCGIVVRCTDLLTLPFFRKVAASLQKEDGRRLRDQVTGVFHISMVVGLWGAVFMTVMAPQLASMLLTEYTESGTRMLQSGGVLILLGGMSMIYVRLLSYKEKYNEILILMGIYVIGFVAGISIFFKTSASDNLVLVFGGLTAVSILAVLSGFLVFRIYKGALDAIRTVLIPAVLACVSGLACVLIVHLLLPHLGAGMTVLVAFVVSLGLYWASLLFLNNFKSWELACLPGGRRHRRTRRNEG